MSFLTFNSNLSWRRSRELLEHEAKEAGNQYIPVVCGQEHGLEELWWGECSASQKAKGWRVVGANAAKTSKGRRAGTYIAVPSAVVIKKATGQEEWDISPRSSPGRLCMALVQCASNSWIAVFSMYLWTGHTLGATCNAIILDEAVKWIVRLKLAWAVGADWQNEPDKMVDSPWNKAVHGVVKAPEHGTCRSRGEERTIDFFWMDSRLAAVTEQAQVDAMAPYSPHKVVTVRSQGRWEGHAVRALRRPRQFPMDKPEGAGHEAAFPEVDLQGDAAALDDAYGKFCEKAEEEIVSKLCWTQTQAKPYLGRARPPEFEMQAVMPKCTTGMAASGTARAWRWMAQEVAWLGVLYCKWLTNVQGRDKLQEHLLGAWNRVLGAKSHWDAIGQWQGYIWKLLQAVWVWKGVTIELIKALGELQKWLSHGATKLELHLMNERENQLRERLEDKYPGSVGLLHRICKWKGAWKPRKGSVTKKELPAAPQQAVEAEERDWAQVWNAMQVQERPLWRTCETRHREMSAITAETLRPLCGR